MFIAVFAISSQTNAQLGVKLGYNFAKISGADGSGTDEKSVNNVLLGAFFEKDLIPLLDLRVGAEFSPKGIRLEGGGDFDQIKINYLEIPVQAKLKIGPVYALGGVYGAFALKGENEYEYSGVGGTDEIDFDDWELKKFDYGMKFGGGFQFGFGPLKAYTQAEYSFGLQNISKTDGEEWKNNVFSVSAGVVVGF